MARYFFDLRYAAAKLAIDAEGEEVGSDALARARALRIARDMTKTPSHAVRDWMTCSLEVMDRGGKLAFTVPFTEIVTGARGT